MSSPLTATSRKGQNDDVRGGRLADSKGDPGVECAVGVMFLAICDTWFNIAASRGRQADGGLQTTTPVRRPARAMKVTGRAGTQIT